MYVCIHELNMRSRVSLMRWMCRQQRVLLERQEQIGAKVDDVFLYLCGSVFLHRCMDVSILQGIVT